MKTYSNTSKRLLNFAKHLSKIKTVPEPIEFEEVILCELEVNKRIEYKVKYPSWIFHELPKIFSSWQRDVSGGQPLLKGIEFNEDTYAGIFNFFQLSPGEFMHLFDLNGNQDIEMFGGNKLTEKSDGPAIAKNIYEFVRRKENKIKFNYSLN